MTRKFSENPEVEKICKEVFGKGFNIYQNINRVKKELNLRESFPDDVIIGVCRQYLERTEPLEQPYPWFVVALKNQSAQYFSERHGKESAQYKQGGMAQSVKSILKGMFE